MVRVAQTRGQNGTARIVETQDAWRESEALVVPQTGDCRALCPNPRREDQCFVCSDPRIGGLGSTACSSMAFPSLGSICDFDVAVSFSPFTLHAAHCRA
jgi:hypothetical protein